MAPGGRENAQLGIRHGPDLGGVVVGRKVEVAVTRHDDSAGAEGAQRTLEVAAVGIVRADVAVLPVHIFARRLLASHFK